MTNEVILGAAIGGLVGFVLALPAIIVEFTRRVKNLPLLVDIKTIFGRRLRPEEVFAVSLLLHLVLATLVGGIYVIFAEQGWLFITHNPYALTSLLIFSVLAWCLIGLIIFPIFGLGLFGRRLGQKNVWAEMMLTYLLIAVGLWFGFSWFQPFFFN